MTRPGTVSALVATTLPDDARPRSRGDRWRMRLAHQTLPSIQGVLTTPLWHRGDAAGRDAIGRIAALIALRPAIDREVCGSSLRALADAAGEPLFDAVCALERRCGDVEPGEWDALPADAAALDQIGRRLLAAAERGDDHAAACAHGAVALIRAGVAP